MEYALQYVKEQTPEICLAAVNKMDMHYNMLKIKHQKFVWLLLTRLDMHYNML